MKRLRDAWLTPMPAERLALVRILVGLFALIYLLSRIPNLLTLAEFSASQFFPVGPVSVLSAPLPGWAVQASVALAVLSGVGFVLGAGFAVTGPLFALSFLGVMTYRSSWGMVFHTENLLALHLLLLGVGRSADALSVDAKRRALNVAEPSAEYGWVLRAMSVVTVVAYALAGVAKLKLAGGPWLEGELLRRQIAYDNLRKLELGTSVSPLGPWIVRHAWLFPPLAILTMVVELGAPVALVHRRIATVWALAAWCFHLGVLLMMSIAFIYQLSGVAYLSLFPVERGWQWLKQRRSGRRQSPAPSPDPERAPP
jgi:hypothetical protein